MIKLYFSILSLIQNHRWKFISALSILFVLLAYIFSRAPFDCSVYGMLPDNKDTHLIQAYLEQTKIRQDYIIFLEQNSGDKGELLKNANLLEENLRKIGLNVWKPDGFFKDMNTMFISLKGYVPALFDSEMENEFLKKISPDGIDKQMRINRDSLLLPFSAFQHAQIQYDPMLFVTPLLRELHQTALQSFKTMNYENGFFLSQDGRNLFFKLNICAETYDFNKTNQLMRRIEPVLTNLPQGIKGYLISPHVHSVYNEIILKKDIQKTTLVMSVFLMIMIFGVLKNWKGIFVFLLPNLSLIPALFFISVFFHPFSLIAVGFGSFIVGIGVDYGLHVFLSIHHKSYAERNEILTSLLPALILNYACALSVFVIFLFSRSNGFVQLAVFTIVGITCCFLMDTLILPALVSPGFRFIVEREIHLHPKPLYLTIWVVLMFISILFGARININSDIKMFDGSPKPLLEAEKRFISSFNIQSKKFLITSGETYLDAYNKLQKLNLHSPLMLLRPPAEYSAQNIRRWNKFWKKNSLQFEKNFNRCLEQLKFSKKQFSEFVNFIKKEQPEENFEIPEFIREVTDPLVYTGKSKVCIITWLSSSEVKVSGVFSQDSMVKIMAEASFAEMTKLGLWAFVVLLALCIGLSFKVKKLMWIFVPPLSAILGVFGMLGLMHSELNAAHIAGLVMILGLSMDYGMYIHQMCTQSNGQHFIIGVLYSSITALIGGLSLWSASHVILSSLGFSLTVGILVSFLTSCFVLPYLMKQRIRE